MGVILGLIGAVCWGVADFAARFASRRVGAYRTLFYMQFFGFIVLTAYLFSLGGISRGVAPGWHPWALAVVAGLLNMTASLSLYYSFQIGVMTIVAPVSSSYPALTVMLALLSGERLPPVRAAGLVVTLLGVILAATSFTSHSADSTEGSKTPHRAHLSKGVGWAIFAAIIFGVLFWFLGFHVVPLVGSTVSVWVIRLTSFSTLLLAAAPARQTIRLPRGSVWWLLAAVGFMDTAAFVANNAGLHTGQISIVSVLASLYGAVTVLLSWIFLRERLERSQWLGIVLIFAGIVLVSL
ncbi:MAG: DMT family transporter [Candidatus Acidiferrales bacterium]